MLLPILISIIALLSFNNISQVVRKKMLLTSCFAFGMYWFEFGVNFYNKNLINSNETLYLLAFGLFLSVFSMFIVFHNNDKKQQLSIDFNSKK